MLLLLSACRRGNTAATIALLQTPNAKFTSDELNEALITCATHNNHTSIILILLAHKRCDPTFRNSACLREAARHGHSDILDLLLVDDRADPCACQHDAMYAAASNNHLDCVKLLLHDERSDPSVLQHLVLRSAASRGHIQIVKELMNDWRVGSCPTLWEYDVRVMTSHESKRLGGKGQQSVLVAAASNGHVEVVRFLTRPSAVRVTPPLHVLQDALEHACKNGHVGVVKLMLMGTVEEGTDRVRYMANPGANQSRALMEACRFGQLGVVQCLLYDARVNPTSMDDFAIRVAAAYGHHNVVRLLLTHSQERQRQYLDEHEIKILPIMPRANPAADDSFTLRACAATVTTTFHDVTVSGCDVTDSEHDVIDDVTIMLINDLRVDPTAEFEFSLRRAARNNRANIVRALLADDRVDPRADDHYALRWACALGHIEIVNMLLGHVSMHPATSARAVLAHSLLRATIGGHAQVVALLIGRVYLASSQVAGKHVPAIRQLRLVSGGGVRDNIPADVGSVRGTDFESNDDDERNLSSDVSKTGLNSRWRLPRGIFEDVSTTDIEDEKESNGRYTNIAHNYITGVSSGGSRGGGGGIGLVNLPVLCLWAAASLGHVDVVRELFRLNCQSDLWSDESQLRALRESVLGGHLEIVQLILNTTVHVNGSCQGVDSLHLDGSLQGVKNVMLRTFPDGNIQDVNSCAGNMRSRPDRKGSVNESLLPESLKRDTIAKQLEARASLHSHYNEALVDAAELGFADVISEMLTHVSGNRFATCRGRTDTDVSKLRRSTSVAELSNGSDVGKDVQVCVHCTSRLDVLVYAVERAARGGHETVVKLLLAQLQDQQNNNSPTEIINEENSLGIADENENSNCSSNVKNNNKNNSNGKNKNNDNDKNNNKSTTSDEVDCTQALILASHNGHKNIVKLFLSKNASKSSGWFVNPGARGSEALRQAVLGGYSKIVKVLLKDRRSDPTIAGGGPGLLLCSVISGVSSNVDNNNNNNNSVANKKMYAVVLALLSDARVDVGDGNGRVLEIAWESGHTRLLHKVLLDTRPSHTEMAVLVASRLGRIHTLRRLILSSSGSNRIVNMELLCVRGNAPLLEASRHGHTACVEFLLECGADPKTDHRRALIVACMGGYVESVQVLLNYDPRVPVHPDAQAAVMGAATNGHASTLALLLKSNTNHSTLSSTNSSTFATRTAPDTAATTSAPTSDPRPDTHVKNNYNMALFCAVEWGHVSCVKMLLMDHRVDVRTLSFLPVVIAAGNGHLEIIQELMAFESSNGSIVNRSISVGGDDDNNVENPVRNAFRNLVGNSVRKSLPNSLRNPVDIQVRNNDLDSVRQSRYFGHPLLRLDPSSNDNQALRDAATNGYTDVVAFLLQDPRVDPSSCYNQALCNAVRNGHTDTVICLLGDPRVDPGARSDRPITDSAAAGFLDVTRLLMLDPRRRPSHPMRQNPVLRQQPNESTTSSISSSTSTRSWARVPSFDWRSSLTAALSVVQSNLPGRLVGQFSTRANRQRRGARVHWGDDSRNWGELGAPSTSHLQAIKAALENGHVNVAKMLLDNDRAMAECAYGVDAQSSRKSVTSPTASSASLTRSSLSSHNQPADTSLRDSAFVNESGENWGIASDMLHRLRSISDATLATLRSPVPANMTSSSPFRTVDIGILGPALCCAVAANQNRIVELLIRRCARRDEQSCVSVWQGSWPLDILQYHPVGGGLRKENFTCKNSNDTISTCSSEYEYKDCSNDSDSDSDNEEAGWHSGASDTEDDGDLHMKARSLSRAMNFASSLIGANSSQLNAVRVASKQGNKRALYVLLRLCDWDDGKLLKSSTAIPDAVVKCNITVVQRLLKDGRVNAAAGDNLALREAARTGQETIVNMLLQDSRVDPSSMKHAALRYAAERGFQRVGNLLLNDPRTDVIDAWVSAEAWHQKRAVELLLTHPVVQRHVMFLPMDELQQRRATQIVLHGWLKKAVLIVHASLNTSVRKNVCDVMRLLIMEWCVVCPLRMINRLRNSRRAFSLF